MESYPVDIDPGQVVRWLLAEQSPGPLPLQLRLRRQSEVRNVEPQGEARLGDEEREDLHEIVRTATLEIAPLDADDGWLLTIGLEEELGPRILGAAAEGEQEIDLDTFYDRFLKPDRGTASITAEVDGLSGEEHLARLLNAIESNSHPDGARGR